MENRKCPECGEIVSERESVCPKCGCPLKADLGAKRPTIFLVVAAIIAVAIIVSVIWVPLCISNSNYEKAVEYETNLDYEEAINCYSKVIPHDKNYNIACSKVEELTKDIENCKFLAKAFLSLKNQGCAQNFSDLSEIKSDDGKMSCRIGGIGYIVSSDSISGDNEYIFASKDSDTNFCVAKYEATYIWNGWLTVETNQIRQGTSDILFDTARPSNAVENSIIELAQKYFDIYEETHNISILENNFT